MWQQTLREWVHAQRLADENPKLLLADDAANTDECIRRMKKLYAAEAALLNCVMTEKRVPREIQSYVKARIAYETETHPRCVLSSAPMNCAHCKRLSKAFFGQRDWLRDHGESFCVL